MHHGFTTLKKTKQTIVQRSQLDIQFMKSTSGRELWKGSVTQTFTVKVQQHKDTMTDRFWIFFWLVVFLIILNYMASLFRQGVFYLWSWVINSTVVSQNENVCIKNVPKGNIVFCRLDISIIDLSKHNLKISL